MLFLIVLWHKDSKTNGKRKAENGKLLFFDYRLEWKTEPTHEARAEAACRLMPCKKEEKPAKQG